MISVYPRDFGNLHVFFGQQWKVVWWSLLLNSNPIHSYSFDLTSRKDH